MIPPSFKQDLLARADIVEIVGRYVQLKKAGLNFKGLCPFHGEKTPSFIVSPTRQTYHCFGCGVHGTAIDFLMEHGALGYVDAVKELAQQYGLQVPEDDSTAEQRALAAQARERQATLSEVLAKAAEHYRKQLKGSPRAVQYLKGRGLTGEIAARFGLGYAPDGWRGLASVFPRYDDPLLEESGLVIAQGEGEDAKRYDRFRDRVMFPIRSVKGEVIGFGGRVLDQGEPKYLNSPETPVFVKGRELYGLHEARAALRQRGYALVVEGYMDVVALAQLGFPNAVATLGTACTAEHVHKLFRFTDAVVFSFDGDAAGRRAAGRALEAALPHATDTRSVRFLFLPPEHDPDSYVREFGTDAFERCVADAVPLSRQLIEAARDGCDLSSAEGRARFLAQAKPLWQALPDGLLRRQILADLAQSSAMPVEDLQQAWQGGPAPRAKPPPPDAAPSRRAPASRRLLTGTATLLDRALWLLVCRIELWDELGTAAHDLLAEQPAPYGPAFLWIERHLHEHGPENAETVLQGLLAQQEELGEQGAALLQRVASFHANDPDVDIKRQLHIVLDQLTLAAIKDEWNLLSESGDFDGQAIQRTKELARQYAELKKRLTET
ncbi:DNA primase [Schlegelella sp. S2-27]|uniref:DNA primase n=1 Tax=Caldimonas mangrovi TaxID=2944811 RepID=A0ABT0YN28_9BURK|nr:DNA primase [Caldimonas mangrovi]